MRKIFLALTLLVLLSFNLYAVNIDIPQVLKDLGYESDDLVEYTTKYNEEYFTLANWQTEDPADTITFVLIDGEIVDWISR